jgi:hypothetical protein
LRETDLSRKARQDRKVKNAKLGSPSLQKSRPARQNTLRSPLISKI